MSIIPIILNVSEEKIGQTTHKGQVLFSAERLCNHLGYDEEKVPTFDLLKDEERVNVKGLDGESLYVTELGAVTLILEGKNIRAIEAREVLFKAISKISTPD